MFNMKLFVVVCLSTWLVAVARAEDKPKTPAAPAAPAAAAAPVAPTAPADEHKSTDVVARVGKTEIQWGQLDPAVNTFIKQFSARGRAFPMDQLGRLRTSRLITSGTWLARNRPRVPNLAVGSASKVPALDQISLISIPP